MKLGMIGLGKMGANMSRRLIGGGHEVVVTDLSADAVAELAGQGASPAASIEALVAQLASPRVVWIMVPSGAPTESVVRNLAGLLEDGDIVIDGGNSLYKEAVRRHGELAPRGVQFVDVGTSGGVWGAERGYCLMVGGDPGAFETITPILRTLAPGSAAAEPTPGRPAGQGTAEEGFLHCGPAGAGHFVKMVHNGIEYGLMQAYAEGFDLLASADRGEIPDGHRYDLDVKEIAEVWRRGSVVGSWLLDLTAQALARSPRLEEYSGHVSDSGEGRWTVDAAVERSVPANVLAASLFARFRSRQQATFGDRSLSAMRHMFGGHVEQQPEKE